MINQELKKAAHEPAHDAVIHNYDRTQLHTCIDEACPHRGYIVHFLAPFKIGWTDDKGQMHNACKLEPLSRPETPNSTETKPFLRVKELGGSRHRLVVTRVGSEQAEARALANREREKLQETRDLPSWMLKPCPFYAQTPNDCLYGLDKCEEAKACFLRRLAVPRRDKTR